jgi:hypothetical protein
LIDVPTLQTVPLVLQARRRTVHAGEKMLFFISGACKRVQRFFLVAGGAQALGNAITLTS